MMVITATLAHGDFRQNFGECGNDVTHAAAKQAFLNWTEKHPEKWTQPNYLGVTTALSELWPCDASPRK
ncbi:MAG: hypothetical protein JSS29_11020 [Proteobacteria bacterium]|nr:hypothetical protein [Pseudomonadota bacterium]